MRQRLLALLPAITLAVACPLRIEAPSVTIDGGGTITLEGAGGRIVQHRTFGSIGRSTLTLRGLALSSVPASGNAYDTVPCSTSAEAGGFS